MTPGDPSQDPIPAEDPTPAELRAAAGAAEMLASQVADLEQRLRAASDPVRHAGFRIGEITGQLRAAARGLGETASDLARVRSSRDDLRLCPAEWGVCPEHGNTLTSSAGVAVCRVDGRSWSYDRLGSPCGEPITHEITDPSGGTNLMCHGHAIAVPADPGWSARRITSDQPGAQA